MRSEGGRHGIELGLVPPTREEPVADWVTNRELAEYRSTTNEIADRSFRRRAGHQIWLRIEVERSWAMVVDLPDVAVVVAGPTPERIGQVQLANVSERIGQYLVGGESTNPAL
jgi:hypothetical protein